RASVADAIRLLRLGAGASRRLAFAPQLLLAGAHRELRVLERLRGRFQLSGGGGEVLAHLLQRHRVGLGELTGLGAALLEGGLDRGDERLLLARQSVALFLEPDRRGARGHQDLVEAWQRVAHLLDRLLEHDLRVFGERDEIAHPALEHPHQTLEHRRIPFSLRSRWGCHPRTAQPPRRGGAPRFACPGATPRTARGRRRRRAGWRPFSPGYAAPARRSRPA